MDFLPGDSDSECEILIADEDLQNVERLGGGSQMWRAVSNFLLIQYIG